MPQPRFWGRRKRGWGFASPVVTAQLSRIEAYRVVVLGIFAPLNHNPNTFRPSSYLLLLYSFYIEENALLAHPVALIAHLASLNAAKASPISA